MAEPGVYMIANLTIHDPERYRLYEKGFFPILTKHGGSFMTFDDHPSAQEGDTLLHFLALVHELPARS